MHSAFIPCDEGYVATGGGFDVTNTRFEGHVKFSNPLTRWETKPYNDKVRDGWGWGIYAMRASNMSPNYADHFTGYAVCVKQSLVPGYKLRTDSGTIPIGGQRSITTRCNPNELAVGGASRSLTKRQDIGKHRRSRTRVSSAASRI